MVEVVVAKLGVDTKEESHVVFLQERGGARLLPIWIGKPEFESILAEMYDLPRSRPITHDLCKSLIVGLRGELRRIQITRIVERTYFAELHLVRDGEPVYVDARPSDSIAIALRLKAPIYVAESLFADSDQQGELQDAPGFDPSDLPAEQLKAYLERLRPEDFGKFKP
jgi:uncharacterized protein